MSSDKLDLCLATAKGWVIWMNLSVLVFKIPMFNKFLFFIKFSIKNQPEMLYLKVLNLYIYLQICDIYGEGNGTPLQYTCLENPMDGGAW